jgi:hypothetical protein
MKITKKHIDRALKTLRIIKTFAGVQGSPEMKKEVENIIAVIKALYGG